MTPADTTPARLPSDERLRELAEWCNRSALTFAISGDHEAAERWRTLAAALRALVAARELAPQWSTEARTTAGEHFVSTARDAEAMALRTCADELTAIIGATEADHG